MRIALAQFNPTVGDFSGNSRRILDLAAQAKSRGAQLAIAAIEDARLSLVAKLR